MFGDWIIFWHPGWWGMVKRNPAVCSSYTWNSISTKEIHYQTQLVQMANVFCTPDPYSWNHGFHLYSYMRPWWASENSTCKNHNKRYTHPGVFCCSPSVVWPPSLPTLCMPWVTTWEGGKRMRGTVPSREKLGNPKKTQWILEVSTKTAFGKFA